MALPKYVVNAKGDESPTDEVSLLLRLGSAPAFSKSAMAWTKSGFSDDGILAALHNGVSLFKFVRLASNSAFDESTMGKRVAALYVYQTMPQLY